jgi:hypothetical protein
MKLAVLPNRLLFYFLFGTLFLFTACKKSTDEPVNPSVVTIDPSTLNITKSLFEGYRLNVKLNNVAVDTSDIKWISADTRIATVSGRGIVQSLAAGQTTITAALINGKGSAVCKVTVNDTNAYKFRITLKDKGTSGFSINNPSQFLSAKAIARRQKMHIAIDDTDLPISADYIKALQNVGGVVVVKSKWLNSVSV